MALDPVTGGLISAGLKGISGIFSANKAYTRQKEMMRNAHQWEVQDLRKAGLNPILSATGGSGASASSPLGSDTIDMDLASAAQMKKQLSLNEKQTESNINLQEKQADKAFYEGRLSNQLQAKTEFETALAENRNRYLFPLEVERMKQEIKAIERNSISSAAANLAAASSSYSLSDYYSTSASNLRLDQPKKGRESDLWKSTFGEYLPYVEKGVELFGKLTGSYRDIKGRN
jgi:hypothetical protein